MKIYPLPEAITNKRYEVSESPPNTKHGRCDNTGLKMMVPLDSSEASRFVRTHELAHLKWSPENAMEEAKKYEVSLDALLACEDARVNILALEAIREKAFDMGELGPMEVKKVALLGEEAAGGDLNAERKLVLLMIAGYRIKGVECLSGVSREGARNVANTVINHITRDHTSFNSTIIAAREIDDIYKFKKEKIERERLRQSASDELEEASERCAYISAEELSDLVALSTDCSKKPLAPQTSSGKWIPLSGKMEILAPRLTVRHAKEKLGKGPMSSDEGISIRHISRFCVDKAVFKRDKRVTQGTLLIDKSGSMRLDISDIRDIVEKAPLIKVAAYNGFETAGRLWILADMGRRVASIPNEVGRHGGNIIDYEALKWLSRQKKPRYWLSDGAVTSINDVPSLRTTLACHEQVKDGKIVRVPTLEMLLKIMKMRIR